MASTITRDQFFQLMADKAGPESSALIKQVLERADWQQKATFTQDEVISVMAGVTQYAREALTGPAGPAQMDAETRSHVDAMLDVLDQHAFPILRANAESAPAKA